VKCQTIVTAVKCQTVYCYSCEMSDCIVTAGNIYIVANKRNVLPVGSLHKCQDHY
jgi:hypothetical protein